MTRADVVRVAILGRVYANGLAVHRAIDSTGTFVVTHVRSGRAVATLFESEERARRCALALGRLSVDWRASRPKVLGLRRQRVRTIIAEHGGRRPEGDEP